MHTHTIHRRRNFRRRIPTRVATVAVAAARSPSDLMMVAVTGGDAEESRGMAPSSSMTSRHQV
jgi:hypothetical protein